MCRLFTGTSSTNSPEFTYTPDAPWRHRSRRDHAGRWVRLRAAVIVDAGGRARLLDSTSARRAPAEQTAFGLVIDEDAATPLTEPGAALFMDWRTDHGETGWPTFLYAIPWAVARYWWRRPRWPAGRDCRCRCCAGGCTPDWPTTECGSRKAHATRRCGFRWINPDTTGAARSIRAAAPLIHPATGFSVATSLQLAPTVAAALAAHLPSDPDTALAAATQSIWPPSARAIHRFRLIGLKRCCGCLRRTSRSSSRRFLAPRGAPQDLPDRSRRCAGYRGRHEPPVPAGGRTVAPPPRPLGRAQTGAHQRGLAMRRSVAADDIPRRSRRHRWTPLSEA